MLLVFAALAQRVTRVVSAKGGARRRHSVGNLPSADKVCPGSRAVA
jgi:hypothetical protein